MGLIKSTGVALKDLLILVNNSKIYGYLLVYIDSFPVYEYLLQYTSEKWSIHTTSPY